jgi:hypothetical protein
MSTASTTLNGWQKKRWRRIRTRILRHFVDGSRSADQKIGDPEFGDDGDRLGHDVAGDQRHQLGRWVTWARCAETGAVSRAARTSSEGPGVRCTSIWALVHKHSKLAVCRCIAEPFVFEGSPKGVVY